MKRINFPVVTLSIVGSLMVASTAMLTASAASATAMGPNLAPGAAQATPLNNAQVAVAKKVLIEQYRGSVKLLKDGEACMQKVVTHEQLQACMNEQSQATLAAQQNSAATMMKMEKDMQAAASKK